MSALGGISALWWGAAAVAAGTLILVLILAMPERRIDARKRLQHSHAPESALSRTATGATFLLARAARDSARAQRWAYALDRAGVRRPLPEVLVLLGAAAMTAFAIGTLLKGVELGLMAAVTVIILAVAFVILKAGRRRRQFTDQLDDILQLLASNLRAGHSLLQAINALVVDVEEPARSELSRVVNQVRVGRDLGAAIDEAATRMDSEDFTWVAQAISIHRRVGGNLSDVLDTISVTIRERNQIRRQVNALSAEGKMSAVILMALPVVVALILSVFNPVYFQTFTQSFAGLVMVSVCILLMTVGGLWLWRMVKVDF